MKRSLAGLLLVLATVSAVVMPVAPAMAAGECKDHKMPIVWPAGVNPDHNGNGIVCFKVLNQNANFSDDH